MAMSSWLDAHLELFVRPKIGIIPNVDRTECDVTTFTPQLVRALRGVMRAAVKAANGRPILLAGRDVWQLEVVAQVEGYHSTVFRPDISSNTVAWIAETEGPKLRDHYLVDTGYRGTIPKKLGIQSFHLIRHSAGPNDPFYKANDLYCAGPNQLFPRQRPDAPIGGLSCAMEGSAKYWNGATMEFEEMYGPRPNLVKNYLDFNYPKKPVGIKQDFSERVYFTRAAILTMHIVRQLPSRVIKRGPILHLGRFV